MMTDIEVTIQTNKAKVDLMQLPYHEKMKTGIIMTKYWAENEIKENK